MRKVFLWTAVILLSAAAALLALVPFAVPPIVRHVVTERLYALGVPTAFKFDLGYRWSAHGPELHGTSSLQVLGTHWRVEAEFDAAFRHWHAQAVLNETEFSESETLLQHLLEAHPVEAVSNLVFSGKVALRAEVERTAALPVPAWSANLKVRDVRASAVLTNGMPVSIAGLSVSPRVSGIDRHYDLQPVGLHIRTASVAGIVLTNVSTSARLDGHRIRIDEARAGVCGGTVSLYSLMLDPQTLNAGLTLFVEDIDAGQALARIPRFNGTASGHLQGKVRLFVAEGGRAIRLRDAALFSTPGEIGNLQLYDATPLTDNLAYAGIGQGDRDNVADALSNLDYSVLRMNLVKEGRSSAALQLKLEGQATRRGITVPVTLNLTLRGDIEQLINTGLKLSTKGRK